MEKDEEIIRDIIYLELNLQQIDQDMDNLFDTSSKEKLHEIYEEVREMVEKWEQA